MFEYVDRPPIQIAPLLSEISANASPASGELTSSRLHPARMPNEHNVAYKCEKDGRISFSDKHCAAGEKTLAVKVTERHEMRRSDNLTQLKQELATMESYRHEREREYTARIASRPVATSNVENNKETQCKKIDRHITAIDSKLRQPHSAQDGDVWTSKRKDLTDESFSIGC